MQAYNIHVVRSDQYTGSSQTDLSIKNSPVKCKQWFSLSHYTLCMLMQIAAADCTTACRTVVVVLHNFVLMFLKPHVTVGFVFL